MVAVMFLTAAELLGVYKPEMDMGQFLFTQPNPSTYEPNPTQTHDANTMTQRNPPITHLCEMQTPALYNPYFYMSVDEINTRFLVVID